MDVRAYAGPQKLLADQDLVNRVQDPSLKPRAPRITLDRRSMPKAWREPELCYTDVLVLHGAGGEPDDVLERSGESHSCRLQGSMLQ